MREQDGLLGDCGRGVGGGGGTLWVGAREPEEVFPGYVS